MCYPPFLLRSTNPKDLNRKVCKGTCPSGETCIPDRVTGRTVSVKLIIVPDEGEKIVYNPFPLQVQDESDCSCKKLKGTSGK